MAINGPVNWTSISVAHAGTGGIPGQFEPSIAYTQTTSYLPRFDYGGGVVDTGNNPPVRAVGTVPGSTAVEIGFCNFAQGDINVSSMGITEAGLDALLSGLAGANPAILNYSAADRYSHSDIESAAVAARWNTLSTSGWSRTGNYVTGFIEFTVTTVAPGETFSVPINGVLPTYPLENFYDCMIDWGDGDVTRWILNEEHPGETHTYASPGAYTVRLVGHGVECRFRNGGDRLKVTNIGSMRLDNLGRYGVGQTDSNGMYHGCSNATGGPDLLQSSSVTIGQNMFRNCTNITTAPDMSNMASLTTASDMFNGCTNMAGTPVLTGLTSLAGAQRMFLNCSAMTGTPDLTGLTSLALAGNMFANCSGLTGTIDLTATPLEVAANNMFLNCSGITGLVTSPSAFMSTLQSGTFQGTNIAAADIDNYLINLDAWASAPGGLRYDGMAGGGHLDANRSGPASAAITSLLGKGWTRVGTYV